MVKIGEKEYTLKEISYLDSVEIGDIKEKESARSAVRKMLILSGVPEEEVDKLSLKDGIELQKLINGMNSIINFQIPTEENQS